MLGLRIALVFCALMMALGCSRDPVGDCRSACEEQRDRMCNGFVGDENCTAMCADAETNYDATVETANRIGCSSEFDAAYSCFSGGDPCESGRCNAEVNSLQACSTAFCTRNPTDSACM